MIWPLSKLKQLLINDYTIREINKMPDELKKQGLAWLAGQTPRVVIAIITIGVLAGMQWFGKLSDVFAACVTVSGVVAQVMNYKVLKMSDRKEGES